MKLLLALVVTALLLSGCTGSPPTLIEYYEGSWAGVGTADDGTTVDLWLEVVYAEGQYFNYTFYVNDHSQPTLTGLFAGFPDGSLAFRYDDNEQRYITFSGIIQGDTLTGALSHTGLRPSVYEAVMERE